MIDLKPYVVDVPNFPRPGILFRDISRLLQSHFRSVVESLDALLSQAEWQSVDAVAGIESRGFILAAAMAERSGKGFVPIRKKGKLPPPVVSIGYSLEYGAGVLEMQPGQGRLLLVDDVVATGGTMSAAAQLCGIAGYAVQGLATLIDLKLVEDYRWEGLQLRSVIRYG